MTVTDQRPNPNSVSHEAVAIIAQRRAGELYQDIILRDAKIQEQQRYITTIEDRLAELEAQAVGNSQPQTARGPADN